MEISINGLPADITLDTEKNLGEVLSGIELWISTSGNRIAGISIDGKEVKSAELTSVFGLEISNIKKLEIDITLWRELAAEALEVLLETCRNLEKAAFEDRRTFVSAWEETAAARFVLSDMPELNELIGRCFRGEDNMTAGSLAIFIEERLRELSDPAREINIAEALVKSIGERMEELPLDLQTGKDRRAAETMQLFSGIGEKLFRIFFIYRSEGLSIDEYKIDEIPAREFIDGFNASIIELSDAYKNQDIVLAGDIAEYELSPKLSRFYNALKELTNTNQLLISLP